MSLVKLAREAKKNTSYRDFHNKVDGGAAIGSALIGADSARHIASNALGYENRRYMDTGRKFRALKGTTEEIAGGARSLINKNHLKHQLMHDRKGIAKALGHTGLAVGGAMLAGKKVMDIHERNKRYQERHGN